MRNMFDFTGRRRPEGWAWGTTDGGQWLTIAGSALDTPVLAVEAADAVAPAPIIGSTQVLARVRRCGSWFEILERAPEDRQHYLVTAVPNARFPWLVTGWCTCSTWTYERGASRFATGWRYPGAAHGIGVEALFTREHGQVFAATR